jgi:hypothetical protein
VLIKSIWFLYRAVGIMRCKHKLAVKGGTLIVLGVVGLALYTFKFVLLVLSIVLIAIGILTLS